MDVDCKAQEEYDEVTEYVFKLLEQESLEVWDIVLDNRPGYELIEDPFWKFVVDVSRKWT